MQAQANPKSAKTYLNEGIALHLSGRSNQAIERYLRAIQHSPRFTLAYLNLGTLFQAQERYAEAIGCYSKLISITPNSALAYFNLAKSLFLSRKFSAAIECLQRTIQITPNFAQAHQALKAALVFSRRQSVSEQQRRQFQMGQQASDQTQHLKAQKQAQRYFKKADKLLDQGKPLEAIERLKKAIEINPKYGDAYYNLGMILDGQGRKMEAIECLRKAVEINPNDASAYLNLGVILKTQGRNVQAIDCFNKTLQINPNHPKAHSNLGNSFQAQGKNNQAIECYRRAIEINPNYSNAYCNLGVVLQKQGLRVEAIDCFKKAIEIDPNYVEPYSNLGLTLSNQGRNSEAIECYKKAIQINPNFAEAYSNLGLQLMGEGKNLEAIECFKKAIGIMPNLAVAYCNLGILLKVEGEYIQAIECLKKAIETNPSYVESYYNLGNYLTDLGRNNEAINLFKKAIEINPKYSLAFYNIGNLLHAQGRNIQAIDCFKKAIENNPNMAQAYSNLGNLLQSQGRNIQAIECFQKSIEINPNIAQPYSNLGNSLTHSGKNIAASDCFRKAIEVNPKLAEVYYNLGLALNGQGRITEAIDCYKKTIEIDPNMADAYSNLGLLLRMQGRNIEAIECYRKAIEIDPNIAQAYINLGVALADQGRNIEAIDCLTKAIEINPNHAEAYSNLGILLNEQGRNIPAIDCCKKAIEINPNYASAYSNLGNSLSALGRNKKAIESYQNAVEINPNFADACYNLGVTLSAQGRRIEAIKWFLKTIQIDSNYAEAYQNLVVAFHAQGEIISSLQFSLRAISFLPHSSLLFYLLGRYLNSSSSHYPQINLFRAEAEQLVRQMRFKAQNDSHIYFNMSLFFISINESDYFLYFGKFIEKFIAQQQPTVTPVRLTKIRKEFQKIYKVLQRQRNRQQVRKFRLLKLILCDTLNFKQQLLQTFDQLLTQYNFTLDHPLSIIHQIDNVIERQTEGYINDVRRQFSSYLLKYFVVKFEKDPNIRQLLLQKYHQLSLNDQINKQALRNTILTIQLINISNICQLYYKSQQTFKQLALQDSQIFLLNTEQNQFYESILAKMMRIKIQTIQTQSQQFLENIFSHKVEVVEGSKKEGKTLNEDTDYFYQLLCLVQDMQDQGSENEMLKSQELRQYKKIARKIQDQMLKEYSSKQKKETVPLFEKRLIAVKMSQKIKSIIVKICQKFSQKQQSLISQTEQQPNFGSQLSKSKHTLLKQFIKKSIQFQKDAYQLQANYFQQFRNILKAQIRRQLVIYIHNNFLYFLADTRVKKDFYELLRQINSQQVNEPEVDLEERLNKLLIEENRAHSAQSQKISNSQSQSYLEWPPQSNQMGVKIGQRRGSGQFSQIKHQDKQKQRKHKRLKRLEARLGLMLSQLSLKDKPEESEIRVNIGEKNKRIQDNNEEKQQKRSMAQAPSVKESRNQYQRQFIHQPQIWQIKTIVQKRKQGMNEEYFSMKQSKQHQNITNQQNQLQEGSKPSAIQDPQQSISSKHQSVEKAVEQRSQPSNLFKKSCRQSQAKQTLLNVSNIQKQRQFIFKNHAYMVRYLSNRKDQLRWIAKHYMDQQSVVRRKEKAENNQYLSFKFSLTRGKPDFLPQKGEQYTQTLWKKGIKQVLWWIYCMVSAIKELEQFGIFHPDLQFRNTILVQNDENDLKRKQKYKVIDFDYAFKIYRKEGQAYFSLFQHTKNMISYFIQRELELKKGSSIFINYMFRDLQRYDRQKYLKLFEFISSPKYSLQVKVDFILIELQRYTFFYHKQQLIKRLQSLIKAQMFEQDYYLRLNLIKQKLEKYEIANKGQMSYQQIRKEYNLSLYNGLLRQLGFQLEKQENQQKNQEKKGQAK